jgi:hypothetical protein
MQLLYVALDSYMSEKNYEDTLQRSVLVFPVFFPWVFNHVSYCKFGLYRFKMKGY